MQVTVYRLREAGRALSYAEIKAQPRTAGRLVAAGEIGALLNVG